METEALWNEMSRDIRGFIRRRVDDDALADDLLQETFVRIHENLELLKDGERVGAWVYRIARNLIIDHHRENRSSDPLPEVAAPEEIEDLAPKVAGWLTSMIADLPEKYRQAVVLSEIEGLPQKEVADRLGLSLSGAKSRIQRGRKKVEERLKRCCSFELDRRGHVIDYASRSDCCD